MSASSVKRTLDITFAQVRFRQGADIQLSNNGRRHVGHIGAAAPRVCVPANVVSVFIGLLATLCLRSTFLKLTHSFNDINNWQCREENKNSCEKHKV